MSAVLIWMKMSMQGLYKDTIVSAPIFGTETSIRLPGNNDNSWNLCSLHIKPDVTAFLMDVQKCCDISLGTPQFSIGNFLRGINWIICTLYNNSVG